MSSIRSSNGSPKVDPEATLSPPGSGVDGTAQVGTTAVGAATAPDDQDGLPVHRVNSEAVARAAKESEELAAQFEEEKPVRVLHGPVATLVSGIALAIAILSIWQVFRPLPQGSKFYLLIFLAGVLPLVFLSFPSGLQLPALGRRNEGGEPVPAAAMTRPTVFDWIFALLALTVCLYPVLPFGSGGYNAFLDRQGLLTSLDITMGAILLVLLLEACRRTTGWILPAVCVAFLAYAYYGGLLPQTWAVAHAGLDFDQIVDALYNSDSGFYGAPLDVAATYIVLFTIYGAVLDLSGAGRFFVELSAAAFRKSRTAAGRTAVASGFLLGTVSGSGAATTVSIGAVTWPILKRAGYPAERAGGMLAAAGVGAILSQPTLGAAAFIIAEYLKVSYLQVLAWATIPTILYYLGILLAVEVDARRHNARPVVIEARSALRLLGRFGYHFLSLFTIMICLALDMSAMRSVVYATILAVAVSFLDKENRLTPRRLATALASGVKGVLAVAAVCASAGIITSATTKTGLGPQAANLLISAAKAISDNPSVIIVLTAVFSALAMTLLGLAVPVTASFVIGWVIIGPALLNLHVAAPAAAMFVFYFAVLSEASPPTALAAVAAAALTGARLVPTMWQTLRYALPAYLAPIAFVVTPTGLGLLGIGGWKQVLFAGLASVVSVAMFAVAAGGWLPGVGLAGAPERIISALSGAALLWIEPVPVAVGVALALVAVAGCVIRRGVAAKTGEPRPEFRQV